MADHTTKPDYSEKYKRQRVKIKALLSQIDERRDLVFRQFQETQPVQ